METIKFSTTAPDTAKRCAPAHSFNHALQRTAPCVTAPAFTAALPPTMLVPRRTPLSLNLGSLDHFVVLFPARQI